MTRLAGDGVGQRLSMLFNLITVVADIIQSLLPVTEKPEVNADIAYDGFDEVVRVVMRSNKAGTPGEAVEFLGFTYVVIGKLELLDGCIPVHRLRKIHKEFLDAERSGLPVRLNNHLCADSTGHVPLNFDQDVVATVYRLYGVGHCCILRKTD